jgi:hypothetical protein
MSVHVPTFYPQEGKLCRNEELVLWRWYVDDRMIRDMNIALNPQRSIEIFRVCFEFIYEV